MDHWTVYFAGIQNTFENLDWLVQTLIMIYFIGDVHCALIYRQLSYPLLTLRKRKMILKVCKERN